MARAQAEVHGGLETTAPISVWFNDNPWGWWASQSNAKVYKTPAEAEQARASLPKDKRRLMVIEPHEEIVQEALDPDAVDPREYFKNLPERCVIVRSRKRGVISAYWSAASRAWTNKTANATVFNSAVEAKQYAEEHLLQHYGGNHALLFVPLSKLVQETLDPDAVDPRDYVLGANWKYVLQCVTDNGTYYYRQRPADKTHERVPGEFGWIKNPETATPYDLAAAESIERYWRERNDPFMAQRYRIVPMIVNEPVAEARMKPKPLPPEEEIDYRKWVTHGGYDSGRELYSDADVRIFIPSAPHTWQKYFGSTPSREWPSFEEPGTIFIVIPTTGKPWGFREYYDQIKEVDDKGQIWDTNIREMLEKYGGGKTVGPVMAAYYKKKLGRISTNTSRGYSDSVV